ncbi:carbohydrate-binding protein CenC [Pseudomonas sp. BF-B-26]|uniref:carbohydrate-binding protein CenC n=1 Tax=Pseudomonas sp. BF-B-26 TaxID=2832400 RepID=UPI001CBB90BB|nr:carbohydrate-binding protein CenC [Pseudomonas sp. BF-B-26]
MDYPKSVPSAGLVNGRFADENPIAGTPGSLIPASWGNSVTQEILNAITAAGLMPSENQTDQLSLAIKELAKLDPQQNFPVQVYRKNLMINGNFDIWQRGAVNLGPYTGAYIADRFRCDWNGNAGVNISRQSFALGQGEVPNEPRYFMRWQQITAGVGASVHKISQAIESVRTLAGKTATLTFWAKADTARQINVTVAQYFGAGGSVDTVTPVGSFQLKTSWTRYSATIQIPSLAGKTLGSSGNDFLRLSFDLPLNVLQVIDLAQIQLEEGRVSTPFELRSPGDELMLCQRYYEKTYSQDLPPGSVTGPYGALLSTVRQGQTGFASQPMAQWTFKVEKRTIPSLSLFATTSKGVAGQWRSGSDDVSSANARPFGVSTRGIWVDNSDIGLVTQTYYIHATADAEL